MVFQDARGQNIRQRMLRCETFDRIFKPFDALFNLRNEFPIHVFNEPGGSNCGQIVAEQKSGREQRQFALPAVFRRARSLQCEIQPPELRQHFVQRFDDFFFLIVIQRVTAEGIGDLGTGEAPAVADFAPQFQYDFVFLR